MKKLSRDEMKKVSGGTDEFISEVGEGGDADCPLNQAACVFAGKSGKARNCGKDGRDFCCCA